MGRIQPESFGSGLNMRSRIQINLTFIAIKLFEKNYLPKYEKLKHFDYFQQILEVKKFVTVKMKSIMLGQILKCLFFLEGMIRIRVFFCSRILIRSIYTLIWTPLIEVHTKCQIQLYCTQYNFHTAILLYEAVLSMILEYE